MNSNLQISEIDESQRVKKITVNYSEDDVLKKFINLSRTKTEDRTDQVF